MGRAYREQLKDYISSLQTPAFPKPGIVRVKGRDMSVLRIARFILDGGRCRNCKRRVYLDAEDENPLKADLAHIRGKRNHGDRIENTKLLCHRCHMREHQYGKSGEKPCPPKERTQ